MKTTLLVCLAVLACACGGGGKPATAKMTTTKSGGAKTAMSSMSQQTGSTAQSSTGSAQANSSKAEGTTCDGAAEGSAFCADDDALVFCSGGVWYELYCSDHRELYETVRTPREQRPGGTKYRRSSADGSDNVSRLAQD